MMGPIDQTNELEHRCNAAIVRRGRGRKKNQLYDDNDDDDVGGEWRLFTFISGNYMTWTLFIHSIR